VPIGVPLSSLRVDLRAETGQSLNMQQAVQSQATQDIMLDRQQRELWDAYQWTHLRLFVDKTVTAGQDVLSYPTEMPLDQISRIYIATGTTSGWTPMSYGIRAFDIPASGAPKGTPRQWGNKVTVTGGVTNPTGQIQLLPIPDTTYTLRFEGQAPCTSLTADTDKCLIDSKAIVLFTAAEILANAKNEAAALKLTKAQNYLRKLLINSGADKRPSYNMAGSGRRVDHLAARPYAAVPGIDYIPS
jgi:hypothetical protein